MAGFKRGGFRGGGGGAFKKGYAKKRSTLDDEEDAPRSAKKAKNDDEEGDSGPVVPKVATDDDGQPFIGLNASAKRRVTISEFNKQTLVNIREYWRTDNGDLKPGKKGISLTIDQYNTLLAALPLIESMLAEKDIQVARPDYDADPEALEGAKKNDEEEKEEEEEEEDDDDDDEDGDDEE